MPSLYGFEGESELPLRRLNAAPGTRGTIAVSTTPVPPEIDGAEPMARLDAEDGTPVYRSYETASGCLLRMPPSGSFDLDPERLSIRAFREDEDDELFEHRLTSSAACTLLSLSGDLALHAAGAVVDDRAAIVCGASWAGKSSLARALGESGHPVLGEDGVVVELGAEPVAYPGPRGIRVRSGERPDVRVDLAADPGPGEPGPCPVGAVIVLLDRGPELTVDRLDPKIALTRLTPTMIHEGSHAAIADSFARLARLLHTVPGFAASLPDELAALPEAAQELLDETGLRG
jgi:hypothetical protein